MTTRYFKAGVRESDSGDFEVYLNECKPPVKGLIRERLPNVPTQVKIFNKQWASEITQGILSRPDRAAALVQEMIRKSDYFTLPEFPVFLGSEVILDEPAINLQIISFDVEVGVDRSNEPDMREAAQAESANKIISQRNEMVLLKAGFDNGWDDDRFDELSKLASEAITAMGYQPPETDNCEDSVDDELQWVLTELGVRVGKQRMETIVALMQAVPNMWSLYNSQEDR